MTCLGGVLSVGVGSGWLNHGAGAKRVGGGKNETTQSSWLAGVEEGCNVVS